jgi:hypothetical protein
MGNSLENFMPISYANSPPEATAFAAGAGNWRHRNGTGHASSEMKMIRQTSPREIFTRCRSSIKFALRNLFIVLMPIKIGHAHASRTRNCPNGSVFV